MGSEMCIRDRSAAPNEVRGLVRRPRLRAARRRVFKHFVLQCKRIFFVQPGAMPSTFSKARERASERALRKMEIERRRCHSSCHGGTTAKRELPRNDETTSFKRG